MNIDLHDEVYDLFSSQQEGPYWDFKREWYANEKKSEQLHDIINMANNLVFRDAYIIFGIEEDEMKKPVAVVGVENDPNRKNTQDVIDFLRSKKFGGNVRPMIQVETIYLGGHEVDVLVIKSDRNVPYYLTERYQKVEVGNVYIRLQDGNTPINQTADSDKVALLWRRRFGLETSIIERFRLYLADASNWTSVDDNTYYYNQFPEFTVKSQEFHDREDGKEFYSFAQTDHSTQFGYTYLYYHQTKIEYDQQVWLDGGRMTTTTAEHGFLGGGVFDKDEAVSYRYRLMDSFNYLLDQFFKVNALCSGDDADARRELDRFIITFHNDEERKNFEKFAAKRIKEFDRSKIKLWIPSVPESEKDAREHYQSIASDCLASKYIALDFFQENHIEDLMDQ